MRVLGLAAALTLGPSAASPAFAAEARAVELTWSAPATCPEATQVHRWIDALTADPERGDAQARAMVSITATERGFASSVVMTVAGESQTRQLEADHCAVLGRAVAVLIAVSLDPVAVARQDAAAVTEPEPEPEPELDAVSVVPVEPGPEPLPPVDRPPERRAVVLAEPAESSSWPSQPSRRRDGAGSIEWGARLGAAVGGGVLPQVGVGASLAPFVGTERFHARAVVRYWARRRIDLDPARDATAQLRMLTGGVRLCPQLHAKTVRIPLCAGVDAGAVFGQGTGDALTDARSATAPWAAAVLEPSVELPVTPSLSLWLGLSGVISLYRPIFSIEGAAQRWTAGPGGVRGWLGVQLHRRAKKP